MELLAKYNIDEGAGTVINDSSGNGNHATLVTSDQNSFWNDSPPMVAQSIIDAEAVQDTQFFTDGEGHALPIPQSSWEDLGGELSNDVNFNNPVTWDLTGNNASVIGGQAILPQTSAFVRDTSTNIPIGTSSVTVDIESTDGAVRVYGTNNNDGLVEFTSAGVHTALLTTTAGGPVTVLNSGGVSGSVVNSVSVREVNPVINTNKQYYFCPKNGLWIYNRALTDEEHLQNVEYMYKNCEQQYEALYDSVSGQLVYDAVSLQLLYDEEA